MVTRAEVVAAARSLLQTPFHHQGREPGVGIDCAGVLIAVAWLTDLKPRAFDVTGYPRAPDGTMLQALCDENLERIRSAELQPADVVLIRWGFGKPQHLGIVGDHLHGGPSLIHADSRRQKRVIETRLEFGRYMRLVQAYRLPGVV
jgi:cell wall-associated NlpC family hydrolase